MIPDSRVKTLLRKNRRTKKENKIVLSNFESTILKYSQYLNIHST
jgi:hypothetical protein